MVGVITAHIAFNYYHQSKFFQESLQCVTAVLNKMRQPYNYSVYGLHMRINEGDGLEMFSLVNSGSAIKCKEKVKLPLIKLDRRINSLTFIPTHT